MKFFKQRKAKLYNGQIVKEGDTVSFINSDNKKNISKIKRRKDGTLFFWNSRFEIQDYTNALKENKDD